MTIIDALESDQWMTICPELVTVDLAAKIKLSLLPTQKPAYQIVARIQCLVVSAGHFDDAEFMRRLYAATKK